MVDRIRMTAAEFLQLPETNRPHELLDGEEMMRPPPIPDHQDVVVDVVVLLKQIAKAIGGKVYVAPVGVYLDEYNIPEPDVLWIAPKSQCSVEAKYLRGAPDLIVEVLLSPGTARVDRGYKFQLYERYGVREYCLVDPAGQYIEVWVRDAGKFVRQGIYATDDSFVSSVLAGTTIACQAIFSG